jgi:hypothetical protein
MYAGPGTEFSGISPEENWKVGVELGYMANTNTHRAWGATVFALYWQDTGNRFGARVIYRRWLSSQVGLDLAPGIVVYADEQQEPAFSGQIALDLAGLVAPMAQIDMIRMDDQVHWSLMGGVRAGSYLGIAAWVVFGLAAIGYAAPVD